MRDNWQRLQVADLIAESTLCVGDGYRAKLEELATSGVPFARAGNIDGGFHFESADRFPERNLARVGDKISQPGDVVFTSKGTVGRFAFVSEKTPRFVYSPQLCFWRSLQPRTINPRFLFYWMEGPEFYSQYKAVAGQTDMAEYVSLTDQRRMYITLPPLEDQQAIADVLGSVDDKIELNRRMNETLEAMARAIFKSWFVDFDPVRTKAEGRQPFGMDAATAALFPSSLQDSSLGKIPKGWRASRIGDVVATLLGGTPSRAEPSYWGGEIPWINSGKANEFRIIEPSEFITRTGLDSSATKLLPSRTTVIAITGATLGQVSLTEIETCANQSIVGVIGNDVLPSEFLYFWVKNEIDDLLAWQTGGAQQHINKNNVNDLQVLVPSEPVMLSFLRQSRPMFDRIRQACLESRTLAVIRDALLPKLISGEIRVTDAERLVENNS